MYRIRLFRSVPSFSFILVPFYCDFCEFKKNPISLIYGFEALKYEFNGYYSCNLNKNGGTVRLIFTSNEDDLITLEFVSTDHYKDFKKVI